MITGIYKLIWQTGHYYIGKSGDINTRFKQHINALNKNKHSNYRVSECFKQNGNPTIEIILVCEIEECFINENNLIKQSIGDNLCLNFLSEYKGNEIIHKSIQGRPTHKRNNALIHKNKQDQQKQQITLNNEDFNIVNTICDKMNWSKSKFIEIAVNMMRKQYLKTHVEINLNIPKKHTETNTD